MKGLLLYRVAKRRCGQPTAIARDSATNLQFVQDPYYPDREGHKVSVSQVRSDCNLEVRSLPQDGDDLQMSQLRF
jgi:hypothetical protein